ncbi:restriction endonuclease subunit S [Lactiplantibacillus pentosus]|jgi:type I restriction enzyme S subunit|uniref:restriction endonuclease subunit S n=1 Tax=Lactiplantibacillus pentosus TaxID=1589 RepID=UPI0020795D78|nr:restriction endonuclease subunit S [Lactiplantibacillus pentosus]USJ87124.1 restriction endonuclease subunit S [Lactiplantibacillus pentosus]
MKNENLVPKVRFKGFSDPWEQRKFTDLTKIYSGLTYSPNDIRETGTLVIRSSNIQNNKIVSADNVYVQSDIVNSINVSVDDVIVVVRNGSRSLIGKHALVSRNMPNTVIGAFMTGLRGNGRYMNALLGTDIFKKEVYKTLGATINQITNRDFRLMIFGTPSDIEKQQIGNLNTEVDNLIAANEDKLEQLKTLKKLLMQKIFSQEWRFKGFTDPWEQRKLGDIYAKNNERNNGQFDVHRTISIANMYFKEGGNGASVKSLANYKVLRIGDIAFEGHESKQFAYGRMVMNDIGDGIMSPRFTAFRPINRQIVSFWKVLIHYEPIMKYILVRSTKKGTMMNELVVEDFLNNSLNIPSEKEQDRVGNVFQTLSSLIAANEDKLQQLKELKKYLMQNMFV